MGANIPKGAIRVIDTDLDARPRDIVQSLSYVVELSWEEDAWIACAPSVPGCHSYGRTLAQARERIRDALSLWVDKAADAVLDFRICLPDHVDEEIDRLRSLLAEVERSEQLAHEGLQMATASLQIAGISLRDSAQILGYSHQRLSEAVRKTRQRTIPVRRPGVDCRQTFASEDNSSFPGTQSHFGR
ncbi:MAG: type II toxin-antitoxin system HicB family antitoxin [Actinomycetota bacterium]|nr:type II toxin-antitoxin system HicB family antitoxin [Actinomycetota bacterium]